MARPPLASVDDLEEMLGETLADAPRATWLLSRASAIVRAFAHRTWLDDLGNLAGVPEDIPGVVLALVERAIRNPDGATTETVGPFNRTFGPDAVQRLFLTASEKSVIRFAVDRTGVGVLTTTRGRMETPEVIDPWDRLYDLEPWGWEPFGFMP